MKIDIETIASLVIAVPVTCGLLFVLAVCASKVYGF